MKIIVPNHHERLSPRVLNEVKSLLAEGNTVKILNWNRGRAFPEDKEQYGLDIENIKLPFVGVSKVLKLFCIFLVHFKLSIKLLKERFDIIHCPHLMFLSISVLFGKLKKAKVVYDVYDFYSMDAVRRLPNFLKPLSQKIIELIENKLVTLVDYVLVIDSARDILLKRYRKFNHNIEVIDNVPCLELADDNDKIPHLKKKYSNNKVLIYIGGITIDKGSMKSIEALNLVRKVIPNVKLIFIGNFLDGSEKNFIECVKRLRMQQCIELIDWLPYEKMLAYLKIADVGLALYQPTTRHLISRRNARKIFTYMLCSLPVVTSDFGEIGKVVKEEKCGILVDPTNAKDIANVVIYLLKNPEQAKRMGRNGRLAVEKKYNWELEKLKLLEAYKKLADR